MTSSRTLLSSRSFAPAALAFPTSTECNMASHRAFVAHLPPCGRPNCQIERQQDLERPVSPDPPSLELHLPSGQWQDPDAFRRPSQTGNSPHIPVPPFPGWSRIGQTGKTILLKELTEGLGSFDVACKTLVLEPNEVQSFLETYTEESKAAAEWSRATRSWARKNQVPEDYDSLPGLGLKLIGRGSIENAVRYLEKVGLEHYHAAIKKWSNSLTKWPPKIKISDVDLRALGGSHVNFPPIDNSKDAAHPEPDACEYPLPPTEHMILAFQSTSRVADNQPTSFRIHSFVLPAGTVVQGPLGQLTLKFGGKYSVLYPEEQDPQIADVKEFLICTNKVSHPEARVTRMQSRGLKGISEGFRQVPSPEMNLFRQLWADTPEDQGDDDDHQDALRPGYMEGETSDAKKPIYPSAAGGGTGNPMDLIAGETEVFDSIVDLGPYMSGDMKMGPYLQSDLKGLAGLDKKRHNAMYQFRLPEGYRILSPEGKTMHFDPPALNADDGPSSGGQGGTYTFVKLRKQESDFIKITELSPETSFQIFITEPSVVFRDRQLLPDVLEEGNHQFRTIGKSYDPVDLVCQRGAYDIFGTQKEASDKLEKLEERRETQRARDATRPFNHILEAEKILKSHKYRLALDHERERAQHRAADEAEDEAEAAAEEQEVQDEIGRRGRKSRKLTQTKQHGNDGSVDKRKTAAPKGGGGGGPKREGKATAGKPKVPKKADQKGSEKPQGLPANATKPSVVGRFLAREAKSGESGLSHRKRRQRAESPSGDDNDDSMDYVDQAGASGGKMQQPASNRRRNSRLASTTTQPQTPTSEPPQKKQRLTRSTSSGNWGQDVSAQKKPNVSQPEASTAEHSETRRYNTRRPSAGTPGQAVGIQQPGVLWQPQAPASEPPLKKRRTTRNSAGDILDELAVTQKPRASLPSQPQALQSQPGSERGASRRYSLRGVKDDHGTSPAGGDPARAQSETPTSAREAGPVSRTARGSFSRMSTTPIPAPEPWLNVGRDIGPPVLPQAGIGQSQRRRSARQAGQGPETTAAGHLEPAMPIAAPEPRSFGTVHAGTPTPGAITAEPPKASRSSRQVVKGADTTASAPYVTTPAAPTAAPHPGLSYDGQVVEAISDTIRVRRITGPAAQAAAIAGPPSTAGTAATLQHGSLQIRPGKPAGTFAAVPFATEPRRSTQEVAHAAAPTGFAAGPSSSEVLHPAIRTPAVPTSEVPTFEVTTAPSQAGSSQAGAGRTYQPGPDDNDSCQIM